MYAQDTTKPKTKTVNKEDTTYVQNFILADHNYQYINKTSPDTLTRRRFLWYPAKSLEDIFNYLPGYYQYFMDVGQLNPISFNQLSYSQTGVLRHGRPINDLIDGSIDLNLLSRNEIAEIEVSNGFGNNIYGYSNSVSIIERELFQFRPYTEISFYQDRYENLYFDGNFHQNFFRKLNFNFGITKHSYDGHYTNSDFDKWLGRFNLNFAPSNKLNFFLNVNYAKIQKGLNDGINADTVNIGDKDIMFNSAKAIVNNPDAYEIKERFDVDLGSVFLAGKNSFTNIQMYVSNSFRKYRDEENRPNPNNIFIKNNYHWINYGAKLQQVFTFYFMKDLVIRSRTEIETNQKYLNYNYSDPIFSTGSYSFQNNSILEELITAYRNFNVTAYLRVNDIFDKNISELIYGFKGSYTLNLDSENKLAVSSLYNSRYNYISGIIKLNFGKNSLSSEYYNYKTNDSISGIFNGINGKLNLMLFKFDIEGAYSYNNAPVKAGLNPLQTAYSPKHYGNLSVSWHDVAFKNKLEYKIGLSSRFWSEYYAYYYKSEANTFLIPFFPENPNYNLNIPANATLDFFIIGIIGKATFGLTLENILDRLIYNTGVYPFMDRGGFLNTISRLNITWNFFD